jgi:hypothetical protein
MNHTYRTHGRAPSAIRSMFIGKKEWLRGLATAGTCNCGAWLRDRAFVGETRIEDGAASLVIQRWTTFSFMRADRCLRPCIESPRMRKATFICSS